VRKKDGGEQAPLEKEERDSALARLPPSTHDRKKKEKEGSRSASSTFKKEREREGGIIEGKRQRRSLYEAERREKGNSGRPIVIRKGWGRISENKKSISLHEKGKKGPHDARSMRRGRKGIIPEGIKRKEERERYVLSAAIKNKKN